MQKLSNIGSDNVEEEDNLKILRDLETYSNSGNFFGFYLGNCEFEYNSELIGEMVIEGVNMNSI